MGEPYLKPTVEAQAIARAHRMGQVQSVQIHRLLSAGPYDVAYRLYQQLQVQEQPLQ